MDLQLSEEQLDFKMMARDFAQKRIFPHALEFDEHETTPAELIKECAELGYFGFTVPEEYGGLGQGAMAFAPQAISGGYARALALASMLVNLAGNLALIWPFGATGVGIATALSAWVNVILIYAVLHRRGLLTADARMIDKSWRIVAASAIMGVSLWFGNEFIAPWMVGGLWDRVIALGLLCGGGGLLFALACLAFGVYRPSELKALLRRRSA